MKTKKKEKKTQLKAMARRPQIPKVELKDETLKSLEDNNKKLKPTTPSNKLRSQAALVSEAKKKIRKGWSKAKVKEWLMEDCGLKLLQARNLLDTAYEQIVADNEKVCEKIVAVQLERCEEILRQAMDSNDRGDALKAIDIINKMFCLYIERHDVNVHADVIKFEFDTPEPAQIIEMESSQQ